MPGVYVSRRDKTPSGDVLTTYDVRMTAPNREPALSPQILHTIEHLAATWLRNNPEWSDKIVYWGPMGCCTGSYLIVQGDYHPRVIANLLKDMFTWISNYQGEIPGATPRDCGNWSYTDLEGAKAAAAKYVAETLLDIPDNRLVYSD